MTNLGPEENWPHYCVVNVRTKAAKSTSSSLRRAHASVSERNQDIILGCALRAFAFAISEKFNCSQLRIVCRNTSRSSGSFRGFNNRKTEIKILFRRKET